MRTERRRTRTLVSKLAATAALALCGVVVIAGGAHLLTLGEERRAASDQRLKAMACMGAAVAEETQAGIERSAARAPFARWSWAAMEDPAVVGTARLAADGAVLDLHPDDIAEPATISGAFAEGQETLDTGVGRVRLVSAVTSSGRRVVLLTKPLALSLPTGLPDWAFFPSVLLAALMGWVWLRVVLDRSVTRPLRKICCVKIGDGMRRATGLPIDLDNELGDIARRLRDATEDQDETRHQLGQMKRTMDARVAAQIRQVQGMLKRAERRAWIDPLTKLGNRRLLDDRLEEVYATQKRRGEDLSAIMFDIDNFKGLNDTLGHAAGDELLRFVGELLRGSLRSSDIGLRLGGDEFVTILLGAGIDEAAETAERLTKLFRQRASLFKVVDPVSISCGVASIRQPGADCGEALLAMADKALYMSKSQGKGMVSVHLAMSTDAAPARS